MGAGDFIAGAGPAGHTTPTPSAPDGSTLRSAKFDIQTRTFPLDGNGELTLVHPVDQAVALAVGRPLVGTQSTPTSGLDVARLRRASRASMQLTVTLVVKDALQQLISDGDIAFHGAPLAPDANGRPFFFVDYTNLRLPAPTVRATRIAVRA
jgi:hypothetical protein